MVGGGPVALRKIRLMRSAGAKITVVAPEVCTDLAQEFGDQITHIQRPFEDDDINGYRLITAATNFPDVNAHVSALAQASNIPVNVVDEPALCSFITPSIIDRSPVLIAISTGGGAPVLARLLRAKIEALIPANYGKLADAMRRYRDTLKNAMPDERDRRIFWDKVAQGPIAELFLSGNSKAGEQKLALSIEQSTSIDNSLGEVWLIGAGPGDPDLVLRLGREA